MANERGDALPEQPEAPDDALVSRLRRADARRRRAEGEGRPQLWSQVARVGSMGWLMALPIVGGAMVGHVLDRHFHSGVTWALAGVTIGVGLAAYGLWRLSQDARSGEQP